MTALRRRRKLEPALTLAFTILGDRLDRRPVLIAGTLFYAVISTLAARAGSDKALWWLGFIGGLGLGSVVPNAAALIGSHLSGWAPQSVFLLFAVPAAVSALAMLGLRLILGSASNAQALSS